MTETQKRFLTSYLGECWIEHDKALEVGVDDLIK